MPSLWNLSTYNVIVWPARSRLVTKPSMKKKWKGTKTEECLYQEQKRWLRVDAAGGIHLSPSWWCGLLAHDKDLYDKIFHFYRVYGCANVKYSLLLLFSVMRRQLLHFKIWATEECHCCWTPVNVKASFWSICYVAWEHFGFFLCTAVQTNGTTGNQEETAALR